MPKTSNKPSKKNSYFFYWKQIIRIFCSTISNSIHLSYSYSYYQARNMKERNKFSLFQSRVYFYDDVYIAFHHIITRIDFKAPREIDGLPIFFLNKPNEFILLRFVWVFRFRIFFVYLISFELRWKSRWHISVGILYIGMWETATFFLDHFTYL